MATEFTVAQVVADARNAVETESIVGVPTKRILANLVKIETPDQAQRVADKWNELRRADDAIVAKYKKIRGPVEEAVKAIKAEEKEDRKPYQQAIRLLGGAFLEWKQREADRIEAENAARLLEAEQRGRETQARQAEAIEAAAQAMPDDREALLEQAENVRRAAVIPAVSSGAAAPAKIAGVSTRERWHAEVTEESTLKGAVLAGSVSMAALEPCMSWLDDRAEALHERMAIPGVRAVKGVSMARQRR